VCAAAGAAAGEAAARSRRERAGNWAGKPSVIDQLNELILELRDIEGSIAVHVRLRGSQPSVVAKRALAASPPRMPPPRQAVLQIVAMGGMRPCRRRGGHALSSTQPRTRQRRQRCLFVPRRGRARRLWSTSTPTRSS